MNVWAMEGEFAEQNKLVITLKDLPKITLDDIRVAQFTCLILNSAELRDVINSLTSNTVNTVLILGRFSSTNRKVVLDALREGLRGYNLLPIIFEFDRPTVRGFTETARTFAGLSYFVIADITNPKSCPLELQATVPDYQIPCVPIIQEGEVPFSMMVDLRNKYGWVLDPLSYNSIDQLLDALYLAVIDAAI